MSCFPKDLLTQRARTALEDVDRQRQGLLNASPLEAARTAMAGLPDWEKAEDVTYCRGHIRIGAEIDPRSGLAQQLRNTAMALQPWRKGPFDLLGLKIDAEWRSDHKWERIRPHLPNQKGKRILDIGCNNGYTMFALHTLDPEWVLGIDPVARWWYQFHFLNHFAKSRRLAFRLWGWQEVAHFQRAFDTVFCMGILYHHSEPITMLKRIRSAMKPRGLLVLESIIIPGTDRICLFPQDRYAAMANVWFVPTQSALLAMLDRVGFVDSKVVSSVVHQPAEQRVTAWSSQKSFADFLDPGDSTKTVEGHPAPHRAVVLSWRA